MAATTTTETSYLRRSTGTVLCSSSRSPRFHQRSASPMRLNLYGHSASGCSQSVRFSLERLISSRSSVTVSGQKRTCLCSPTTHPGSFRCALHRKSGSDHPKALTTTNTNRSSCWASNGLNLRRSAMVNSLVRIGGVEGELVKRSLTTLIRPSSHHLRRRADFQPRPSRFSAMSRCQGL